MNFVRLAWFSPFPPVRTGVAAGSAELVAALGARGHLIDPYPVSAAHDFPWIQGQRPYDLVVYQFGNSSHHDYIWPYAWRYPGLAVLHDTHLHHARAALLLREQRRDDYRRELAWSEPAVNADVAELAIAGVDSRLFYDWPMVRGLVERSLLIAVHGQATRGELVERLSDDRYPPSDIPPPTGDGRCAYRERIVSIRLGHGQLVSAGQTAAARTTVRAKYGIAQDAIVFGVFGGLTPEKRLPQILAAFRATLASAPNAHLLLGGAAAPHFPLDEFRAADHVTITGYIDERELTDHIAAIDVSLNLRWPTARETSGPWLRALAAAKPTVITDLVHLADVPSLDPRTWRGSPATDDREPVTDEPARGIGGRASAAPVCVAVDIVDEDHSLRLAMRRLAVDAALRETLGRAGREFWQREHTIDAMTDDYESAFARCASAGARGAAAAFAGGNPAHLCPSGDDTLRGLLAPFGIESPFDTALGRPFDTAQGRPVDTAQGTPR